MNKKLKIGTIAEELSACLGRCKNAKVGDLMHRIHHGKDIEILTEPIIYRVNCILNEKPEKERAVRLHFLSPWPGKVRAEVKLARDEWMKALDEWMKVRDGWMKVRDGWGTTNQFRKEHAQYFPDCPGHGKNIC